MGNVSFQNLQRQNAAIVIQKYIRTLLAKEEMNRRQRMQRARRKVEFIELVAEWFPFQDWSSFQAAAEVIRRAVLNYLPKWRAAHRIKALCRR